MRNNLSGGPLCAGILVVFYFLKRVDLIPNLLISKKF